MSDIPANRVILKLQRRRKLILGLGFLIFLILAQFTGAFPFLRWESLQGNLEQWTNSAEQNPVLSLLIFATVYILVTAFSLPVASLLGLLAGAIFGRWLGTAIVSVSSTIGATIAFLLARHLWADAVQQRLGSRWETMQQGIDREGVYYLFAIRLAPVVPFFVINLAMGLTRIRTLTYALVSWIGMLPGTFLYVNAGMALKDLEKPQDVFSLQMILALAGIGLIPVILRMLIRRRRNEYNSLQPKDANR